MDLKFHHFCRWTRLGLLAAALFITGCAPGTENFPAPTAAFAPTRAGQLTPYLSPHAQGMSTPSPAPAQHGTASPLPSTTPTPRTHEVKKGEDMGGIAWQYRVSVQELMEANPTVQPNMMSVGTLLIIPPSKTELPPGENPTPPTPTPAAVAAGKMDCARTEDGGMWCFMPVKNEQEYFLEGLSAIFRITGRATESTEADAPQVLSQAAYLPLDRLPPGETLPLAAYFPPEQMAAIASPYQFSSELLTALPGPEDGRYVPMHVYEPKVMLAENGRSAQVLTDVIPDGTGNIRRVWVAAVAYDAQGSVVGVRRWERQDSQPLNGGPLAVTMSVYSVAGAIVRVEIFVEARP